MQHAFRLVVLAAGLVAGTHAFAQENTLKAGVIQYNTDSRSNGVTGPGIPAGADAKTGNATTLVLTYEYELVPDLGVELVLGIPPKIKAKGTGSVAYLGDVVAARIVAPTVLFNYHFLSKGSAFRPYIGLGWNYTKFTNISSPYGFDVKLGDSNGVAGQIGFDYNISREWGLFASVGKSKVKSKLVATGATVLQTTIDFRPTTFAFGAAYRF